MLYDAVEPFGSPRDDARAGVIAAVMANLFRNAKARKEPFMPAELFAMFPWAEPEPMDLGTKIRAVLGALPQRKVKRPE